MNKLTKDVAHHLRKAARYKNMDRGSCYAIAKAINFEKHWYIAESFFKYLFENDACAAYDKNGDKAQFGGAYWWGSPRICTNYRFSDEVYATQEKERRFALELVASIVETMNDDELLAIVYRD